SRAACRGWMRPFASTCSWSASQKICAKNSARRRPGRNSVMKRAGSSTSTVKVWGASGGTAPREQFGVRPVHDAVLAYLDRDGTRASVLADRARLSRQAITQLTDQPDDP